MLNIVLYQPEIPENTGNISRNCVGFNCRLHLIKPYGFILNDKTVKRAGLDYWKYLQLSEYDSWDEFEKINNISSNSKIYFLTKYGTKNINNLNLEDSYDSNVFLVFGRETKGISKEIINKYINNTFYIPMNDNVRSFNLSNCVAIMSNEYHRQNKYKYIK